MQLRKVQRSQWGEIQGIYKEAFPKRERKPFFLLKASLRRGKTHIYTVAEKRLLGFVAVIPLQNMLMIDYLAISSKIRSRGVGGFIIEELCKIYKDKKIVLLIEKLDDAAENRQQRIARRNFYVKNGFTSSGLFVNGVSGTMEVMNYGGRIEAEEYLYMQRYALGNIMFRLSKMKLVSD